MSTSVYATVGGKGKSHARLAVQFASFRERRKDRMQTSHRKRRNGLALLPVAQFTITEAMCYTKARAAYCTARRRGQSVEAANDAFDAALARWRPLIGLPTDNFFVEE